MITQLNIRKPKSSRLNKGKQQQNYRNYVKSGFRFCHTSLCQNGLIGDINACRPVGNISSMDFREQKTCRNNKELHSYIKIN